MRARTQVVVGSYTAGRIFALASPFTLAYVGECGAGGRGRQVRAWQRRVSRMGDS